MLERHHSSPIKYHPRKLPPPRIKPHPSPSILYPQLSPPTLNPHSAPAPRARPPRPPIPSPASSPPSRRTPPRPHADGVRGERGAACGTAPSAGGGVVLAAPRWGRRCARGRMPMSGCVLRAKLEFAGGKQRARSWRGVCRLGQTLDAEDTCPCCRRTAWVALVQGSGWVGWVGVSGNCGGGAARGQCGGQSMQAAWRTERGAESRWCRCWPGGRRARRRLERRHDSALHVDILRHPTVRAPATSSWHAAPMGCVQVWGCRNH